MERIRGTKETFDEKLARVLADRVAVVPYDPAWPRRFEEEAARLRRRVPPGIIRRIEHFGSTAVAGLASKPVVDMLIEVASLDAVRRDVVPLLESDGYDYFWRPTFGDDGEPFYAWFIRRDAGGARTHHLHMVEADFAIWNRLQFRDYLRTHADVAQRYGALKQRLASKFPDDRVAYTEGKSDFIARVMRRIDREKGDDLSANRG